MAAALGIKAGNRTGILVNFEEQASSVKPFRQRV